MKKYRSLIIFFFSVVIFLFLFFSVTSIFLKSHTNYDQSIEVPNLLGKSVPISHNELTKIKLNYTILNVGAYNPNFPNGSIVSQNPLPGDKVKEGRKIYLTINPDAIPITIFPDVLDQPFRYAIALLKSYKLKIGSIFYKNDIAKNVVLDVKYNGVLISKVDSLPIYSTVDLYIGTGKPMNRVDFRIPDLNGVLLNGVEDVIRNHFLNLGEVFFDDTVTDSLNTFVYKQSILPSNFVLRFSSETQTPVIDIWMTNDSSKLLN